MNRIARWISYIVATLLVTRMIPFSMLSDYIAEHTIGLVGDGEDAYNNVDLIAIAVQLIISIFIVFCVSYSLKISINKIKSNKKI